MEGVIIIHFFRREKVVLPNLINYLLEASQITPTQRKGSPSPVVLILRHMLNASVKNIKYAFKPIICLIESFQSTKFLQICTSCAQHLLQIYMPLR